MKVSEKSNGAVASNEERRDEAVQIVPAKPEAKGNANEQKGNEAKPQIKTAQSDRNPEKPETQEKPQPESKEDLKQNEHVFKPVLNLESTLKVVNDLHRRCIQRENLLNRINQLEAFEIALIEEGDELETNHFQGCKLMIVDDKNRQFMTTTSGLIKMVAEFIHKACLTKLGEIEANIVFPRA